MCKPEEKVTSGIGKVPNKKAAMKSLQYEFRNSLSQTSDESA